ncbi:hypothetical protein EB118_19955 [bacterium]|nr:hypothetical protein [bacterium]
MTSPPWKFAMLAAWLDGYSDGLPDYCETEKAKTKEASALLMEVGLPDYCETEKAKTKEASALLMEVYENHMKESEKWKKEVTDQA